MTHVAFQFSENKGRYLENLVSIELQRRGLDCFYYKTEGGFEVDFVLRRGIKIDCLIQVCFSLTDEKTKQREYRALQAALDETGCSKGLILTYDSADIFEDSRIQCLPVYEWLLEQPGD